MPKLGETNSYRQYTEKNKYIAHWLEKTLIPPLLYKNIASILLSILFFKMSFATSVSALLLTALGCLYQLNANREIFVPKSRLYQITIARNISTRSTAQKAGS